MVQKTEIETAIKTYILKEFFEGDEAALTSETPLLSSGIIDSISALQLVDFIEEQFGIEFQAHEVDQDNLHSIETLTNFVIAKQ
ncbi:MAG: acyl carrier protein [Polaribacter sp.]|jgi:acyl carrier protein